MVIRIDVTTLPPTMQLIDEADFTAFKVVVVGDHTFVTREELLDLAGPASSDVGWLAKLDSMLEYAERSGWVNAEGAVRAHVEHGRP